MRIRLDKLGILMIIAALGSGLVGCGSLQPSWEAPEVTLAAVRLQELGVMRQVFVLTLAVRNPNDRALPVEAISYRLQLEGREIASGQSRFERQIPPHAEAQIEVDLIADLVLLAQRLPALLRSDRPLEWALSGTVTLAGGWVRLPYRRSGRLDPAELAAQTGLAPRSS
ncbi:LEA type 2 family protein [Thiorhodococcus mannitoliphagus]|uniref:LEA type 2 family protein n=2 Tax=Thiorhodococcus mannitoliphagus TaxID=329406 RepID=A0A6P1DRA4_9GAMM|nr:LEA type 2 family protein [Thiorhodococcus mannitoliphagus]NEX20070.1 LEA type 2 family protein [Thiorhodococcus mannitoliphagus]